MNPRPSLEPIHASFDSILEKPAVKSPHLQVWADGPGIGEYHFPLGSSDRPFHAASVGKLFTAALVFQLVDEGRLSLSDSVVDILPEDTAVASSFTRARTYRPRSPSVTS